jgi:hypothetical protein
MQKKPESVTFKGFPHREGQRHDESQYCVLKKLQCICGTEGIDTYHTTMVLARLQKRRENEAV